MKQQRDQRHPSSQHAPLIGVLVLVLVTSCNASDGPGPERWAGSVDTLASGRIIVHNSATSQVAGSLQERSRLGSLEGSAPDLFGEIGGLALGANGEVYVLDDQASEIRVFGSDGTFQRTIGRNGEGPGEMRNPSGLAIDANETLWVLNWGNGRYSGFDPETGEVRRETRRLASYAVFPWPGLFENGTHLMDVGLDSAGEPAILRLDTAFIPHDTLTAPEPNDDARITFRRGDALVASMLEPFAPRPTWAPRPLGGIVVGEGTEYRLHRLDFSGDTSLTIELERERVRITDAERDSALAAFQERAASLGGVTADRRPTVRDVKPAHGALFVDDQDNIWVRSVRPTDEDPAWDMFGPDGRFLGTIPMPDLTTFTRPVVRNDRMAVATDVNGFPQVVVYDLQRVTN